MLNETFFAKKILYPSCMDSELDLMPLYFDETYKFNYDARRGITLEFGRNK